MIALKAENEEKDKLIKALFELVEARPTVDSHRDAKSKGEDTNVEDDGFDKDLDLLVDAVKRAGEHDRALGDSEDDREMEESEEEEDDKDGDEGDEEDEEDEGGKDDCGDKLQTRKKSEEMGGMMRTIS